MPDDPKLWIAVGTSGLALLGTVYSTIVNFRSQQKLERLKADLQAARDERQAQVETRKIISKFRDPLMYAAYDLQSRIFNILRQSFLTRYLINGSPHEQEYAVENTVFLVAQFLGWTEAIREEIQFLDLGGEQQTKRLRQLQDSIYTMLQNDRIGAGFRLFAGEQRAIGELMIDRSGSSCRCIGFATFMHNRKPEVDRYLESLREDVKQMAVQPDAFQKRLISIQHSLIELLEFLDPQFVQFPQSTRSKV